MSYREQHVCEMCYRPRPLTYYRPADEYICDECWDSITEFVPEDEDVDDL